MQPRRQLDARPRDRHQRTRYPGRELDSVAIRDNDDVLLGVAGVDAILLAPVDTTSLHRHGTCAQLHLWLSAAEAEELANSLFEAAQRAVAFRQARDLALRQPFERKPDAP